MLQLLGISSNIAGLSPRKLRVCVLDCFGLLVPIQWTTDMVQAHENHLSVLLTLPRGLTILPCEHHPYRFISRSVSESVRCSGDSATCFSNSALLTRTPQLYRIAALQPGTLAPVDPRLRVGWSRPVQPNGQWHRRCPLDGQHAWNPHGMYV